MHNEFNAMFIAHATSGGVMLLSGAVAMGVKKGQQMHRLSGKVYAASTAVVGISGLIIAIIKSNQFLIATSIFVLYMMVTAYRSLYLKKLYKEVKAAPIDKLITGSAVVASVYLIGLGGSSILHNNMMGIVPLVFGLLCLRFTIADIKKFTKGPVEKKHWLFNHIAGMIGSYIAGITAFLAVNADLFTDHFSIVLWLLPSAIGTPYIIYSIRKYKKPANSVAKLPLKINLPADID